MTEHAIRRRLASDHTALGEHHDDIVHGEGLDERDPLPISGHAFPSPLEVWLTVPPWWRTRDYHEREIDFGY